MKPEKHHTLGSFLSMLMKEQDLNNVQLANLADVSEGVIRNLLKHGLQKAKDPDPRTLRKVADALNIDALMLFRLADYIPPAPGANSVVAEYLADVFDKMPIEKKDAVMGVIAALTESIIDQGRVEEIRVEVNQDLREDGKITLKPIDLLKTVTIRELANQLIAHYQMTRIPDIDKIEDDVEVLGLEWQSLSQTDRMRILALIKYKLSLDFDPTMVDPEWRT